MRRYLLLGALGLAPLAAAAQPAARLAADTAPVPRELVVALLGTRFGPMARNTIIVGRLPADVPMEVIPPDVTRILGGVESRGAPDGAPSGIAIVVAPRTVPDPLGWLFAHAERAGFTTPTAGAEQEGFVASESRVLGFRCRGELVLSANSSLGTAGERHIAVSVRDASRQQYSPCRPPQEPDNMGPRDRRPRMPTLRMPAGVGFQGGGSSSSGGSRETSGRASAGGPPTELLAHFAKQLADAGWTLGAPVSNTLVAVQTAERRDEEGRALFGMLIVAVVPGTTERDLRFRMTWSPSQTR